MINRRWNRSEACPLPTIGKRRGIGPDCCRSDPCAVCAYYHLKEHALNGGRAKLSREQLEFVGVVARHRDASGGWHQPNTAPYELGSILSAEDTELLQALMMVGSVHGFAVYVLGTWGADRDDAVPRGRCSGRVL
jgi:hypothetical protein